MECVDLTPDKTLWRVFRVDDHGNRFEVARDLSEAAADRLLREFEAKGHKQTYSKEAQPFAD